MKCVEYGVDGIIMSNHAGRQVDGAIARLDALENIVGAVGDQLYIMYDSGIRGASDVVKALALDRSLCLLVVFGSGGLVLWARRGSAM
jgi:lactate 2-monooxygenase